MNGIHANLSLEQKVQLLQKDFLDRDGETFVKIRRYGRLGWESTLPKESAYSDYLLHPKDDEDLIKNAYRQAGDMLTVMDTPFKVNVKITNDFSCTDSNTVWVATEMFDDKDLSVGQRLDTFLGLAIHEGCHLLYTDFASNAAISSKLVGALQNIIEDERIERQCSDSKPGLANFLKSAKYYYFDRYNQKMKASGRQVTEEVFPRLFNCILAMIRYPKVMNPSDMEEFADVLLQVRDILEPYPTCTRECIDAAKEIEKVIMEFMKERMQPQAQSGDGQKSDRNNGDKGSGDSNPHQENNGNNDDDGGTGQGDIGDPGQSSSASGSASDSDGSKGGSGCGQTEPDIQDEVDKAMDRMKDALEEIVTEAKKSSLDQERQSKTVKMDNELVGQICEGSVTRGMQKDTYIRKGYEEKDVYMDSLSRVKRYIPSITRAIRCSTMEFKLTFRGMRSGVLDTGKIAEAYQGVPTVYVRQGEVKSDRIAVCILIDESGSMWGTGDIPARDTAVLINEALSTIPNVDLYIYGHSTSGNATELFVYRENGFHPRYALGSTDSRCGNNDSIAIREVAARVRKHTDSKVLFFMISDGSPNEEPWIVKKAVETVEKDGFSLVAISIDPRYSPALMYSKNVNLSDMSTLAIDLGKLVKKAVMESTTRKVM